MTERARILETFKWVQNNCSGAVRSFSIGYPLWESSEHISLANATQYTVILQTLKDQFPRYSAICLTRIWDKSSQAKSMFKLRNQMSQNPELRKSSEFRAISDAVSDYESTNSSKILITMRDKMFAHTEGVETDHTNSLPLLEVAKILDLSVVIVDKCQQLLMPEKASYLKLTNSWAAERREELKSMLSALTIVKA